MKSSNIPGGIVRFPDSHCCQARIEALTVLAASVWVIPATWRARRTASGVGLCGLFSVMALGWLPRLRPGGVEVFGLTHSMSVACSTLKLHVAKDPKAAAFAVPTSPEHILLESGPLRKPCACIH